MPFLACSYLLEWVRKSAYNVGDFSDALAKFRRFRPPFNETALLAVELTSMRGVVIGLTLKVLRYELLFVIAERTARRGPERLWHELRC